MVKDEEAYVNCKEVEWIHYIKASSLVMSKHGGYDEATDELSSSSAYCISLDCIGFFGEFSCKMKDQPSVM